MPRSSARRTEQQKALDNFSQLWLSAFEWAEPLRVLDNHGQVVAWIVDRIH